MGALLCVRRTRTSLGRAVPYVPRTVAPQARVITGDGDKTREAVATVGTLVTALSGDLAGVAGQISSIQTTATANAVQLGSLAAAQVRTEGEAKLKELSAKTLAAKEKRAAAVAEAEAKLAAAVAEEEATVAAAAEEEERLKAEMAAKAAAAEKEEEEKAEKKAQHETAIALAAALEATLQEVKEVKEAAQIAADAALTGAETSQATKEKLEEAAKSLEALKAVILSLPGKVEDGVLNVMLRKGKIDHFIKLDDELELKAEIMQLKAEIARSAAARPTATRTAPAAAPAASSATRTRARAAAAPEPAARPSKQPVSTPAAAPKRALKGDIAIEMKKYTATLEAKNEAGAFEKKITALASVSTLSSKYY